MRRQARTIAGLCLGTMSAWRAMAASSGDPQQCRGIVDPMQRLACYDLATAPAATVARPAPAPTPIPTPARPESTSLPQPDQFGLDQRQLVQSGRSETAPALKSISGLISHVENRPDGGFVVTLDNGQVWEQAEPDAFALPHPGNRVTVRRGTLGSFQLVTAHHVATRVRRVR